MLTDLIVQINSYFLASDMKSGIKEDLYKEKHNSSRIRFIILMNSRISMISKISKFYNMLSRRFMI